MARAAVGGVSTRAIVKLWVAGHARLAPGGHAAPTLATRASSPVLLWVVFACQVLIGQYYFALNDRLNWFADAVFIESWHTVEVASNAVTVAAVSLGILAILDTAGAIVASLKSRRSPVESSPDLSPFFSSALGTVCVLWSAWHCSYSVLVLNGFLLSSQMVATYAAVLLLLGNSVLTAARFCRQS
jgi:hypothetical protein